MTHPEKPRLSPAAYLITRADGSTEVTDCPVPGAAVLVRITDVASTLKSAFAEVAAQRNRAEKAERKLAEAAEAADSLRDRAKREIAGLTDANQRLRDEIVAHIKHGDVLVTMLDRTQEQAVKAHLECKAIRKGQETYIRGAIGNIEAAVACEMFPRKRALLANAVSTLRGLLK